MKGTWDGHSICANIDRTLNSLPREEIDGFIAPLDFSAPVTTRKQRIDLAEREGFCLSGIL
jgi:hypothetical protein